MNETLDEKKKRLYAECTPESIASLQKIWYDELVKRTDKEQNDGTIRSNH